MDKKIRKFTYSFQRGCWYRMFGGVIWSENGDELLTYLYTYYNPNPHELLLATEEEKIVIKGIINQIIQKDSKIKDSCFLCEGDKSDTNLDQLDDIQPDFIDYGHGECKVTYHDGEEILSPVDEISIQVLDSIIRGMYSDRKELRETIKNVSNSLEVHTIDIRRKSVFLHSIILASRLKLGCQTGETMTGLSSATLA